MIHKFGKWEFSDEQLDEMFEESVRLGKEARCSNCGEIAEQHLHTSMSGDKDWRCPNNNKEN